LRVAWAVAGLLAPVLSYIRIYDIELSLL